MDNVDGASSGSARAGSSFGGWLQRVRRTGEFSDVSVRILHPWAEYRLHTLPLRNGMALFRELGQAVVEIEQVTGGIDAFSSAVDFCYLIKPAFSFENVGFIRSVAHQMGMPELLDSTKKFLYNNVFANWRTCAAFLERYKRFGDPAVDDYIETRCLKVIASACTKAFSETKHVSVPIPAATKCPIATSATTSSSSSLAEILVTVSTRLPDLYMEQLVKTLVEAEVKLSLKCRQGRNIRAWLNYLVRDECTSDRARCWILICLSEMLLQSETPVPRMELSSQYWCSLLEHVCEQTCTREEEQISESVVGRLRKIESLLEERIGASLHELDDYLHSYRFSTATLVELVRHFVGSRKMSRNPNLREQLEEVAAEVDGCLWAFAAEDPCTITPHQFVSIFSAFPDECRHSHDALYGAIERMVSRNRIAEKRKTRKLEHEEIQSLFALVDCDKLSPGVHEQALNSPEFLCQPHVLERVLRMHNEELAMVSDEGDRENLRKIMQKVIKASLKLLEENSRRSKEIMQLQSQYAALLGCNKSSSVSGSSSENSPDRFRKLHKIMHRPAVHPEVEENIEEEEEDGSDEEERNKELEAPQTPIVEARRSLHCMSVCEILSS